MLKVVLVEDEVLVREGLRDIVAWQQYGFEFAGEAADGEMALPLIRSVKPDVLITDIKMPFMDGLALSKIVSKEFPKMKIVIISGYDEFEYAHKAIEVGVEKYLLKPITKKVMQDLLSELKEKIDAEEEQNNYQGKFRDELREYEQFSRRRFYEDLFSGRMSVPEIYELADKNKIMITASAYNIVLLCLMSAREKVEQEQTYSEEFSRMQDEILRYFLKYPEYEVFRWNMNTFGILIKGDDATIQRYSEQCINNISKICDTTEEQVKWYVASGEAVNRLSMLPDCYRQTNRRLSYRFLVPEKHILTEQDLSRVMPREDEKGVSMIDVSMVDPDTLREFLYSASKTEVQEFVESYLDSLQEALQSTLFRNYLMLNIRFTAISMVESMGYSQQEFLQQLQGDNLLATNVEIHDIEQYAVEILGKVIELREEKNSTLDTCTMKRALSYIDEHYRDEAISLNDVAKQIDISSNYFSALFSQQMHVTFTEYVTTKRMERAKELLRNSSMRSGEIAMEIGYKDPHYFSFVFKKTQGITPKEYRHGSR